MSRRSELIRALVSGVGIVTSILLAFAIEASWDARAERIAERSVLEGIRVDLEANLIRIDELMSEHQRADTALVRFFDSPGPESEEDANTAVIRLVYGLLSGDLFDPVTGTLEMLLSSGNLGLISDSDLRSRLWVWKAQVEDLEDDAVGLQTNVRDNRHLLGRLGARGLDRGLRPSRREQYRRLRSSPELSVQAYTVLVDREMYQEELLALRETTELLLEALD